MATIDVLGVPHSYELTAPTATPYALVFIHGWLLSREYWHPLITHLAADYQCLSYDLRGFGASQPIATLPDAPPLPAASLSSPSLLSLANLASQPASHGRAHVPSTSTGRSTASTVIETAHPQVGAGGVAAGTLPQFSPAAYAQDLRILLQQLQLDQVWVVGHSLGGAIALWAAAQMPEQVRGVICLNAGGGIYLKEEFEQFRAAGQQMLKFRPPWLSHLPLLDLIFARMNVASPVERIWGRQRLIDFVRADFTAAVGALLDSTTEAEVHKLPQVVSRLSQPAYFLAGTEDTIMQPKYVHHLASFHSLFQSCGENVIEVEQCGHLAMVEQPELIAAHLRSLLAQHGN